MKYSYADDYDEYEDDYSAENENENELFETGILDFTPAFLCQYRTDTSYGVMLDKWDRQMLDLLPKLDKEYSKHADVNSSYSISYSCSKCLSWEIERVSQIESNIPNFIASALILVVFSAFAVMKVEKVNNIRNKNKNTRIIANRKRSRCCICQRYRMDKQRSHTRISWLGIVSTCMAIITSFGLVGGLGGVPFNAFVAVVPLLLVGIGGLQITLCLLCFWQLLSFFLSVVVFLFCFV